MAVEGKNLRKEGFKIKEKNVTLKRHLYINTVVRMTVPVIVEKQTEMLACHMHSSEQ